MAKLSIKSETVSKSIIIFAQDVSSETGDGLTGLAYNTAGLSAYYYRPGGSATSISLVNLSSITDAYSSGGFKEVDSTNMPGFYRLDIPNACLSSGAESVAIVIRGAANLVPVTLEIEITSGVVTVGTNNDKTGYSLSSSGNSDILAQTLDGSYTVMEALKLIASVICGNRSGGGTPVITFKGLDGSTTRVSLSVDSNGNSTSVPVLNAD